MTDRSQRQVAQQVHYEGEVQGVGFRYTARHVAQRFAVTGFVRNLPDGRVQLLVEGAPEDVERFLEEVASAMAGNITDATVAEMSPTGECTAFEIRS